MKKAATTLAVVSVALSSAVALAAPPRPEPNYCHRIRNAIATGTPVSALPARLVRRCFGNNPPVRGAVQPTRLKERGDADQPARPQARPDAPTRPQADADAERPTTTRGR